MNNHALCEGVVIVEIGAERKKYCIHKALLVHHSKYFNGALRGSWKEAREGLVTLEDVEPAACKSLRSRDYRGLTSPTSQYLCALAVRATGSKACR
jgi:hypothetical protein